MADLPPSYEEHIEYICVYPVGQPPPYNQIIINNQQEQTEWFITKFFRWNSTKSKKQLLKVFSWIIFGIIQCIIGGLTFNKSTNCPSSIIGISNWILLTGLGTIITGCFILVIKYITCNREVFDDKIIQISNMIGIILGLMLIIKLTYLICGLIAFLVQCIHVEPLILNSIAWATISYEALFLIYFMCYVGK